ncbi:unnamed protein product [Brassica oleracea]|uniref:(rape) hypothetical protein n=1 Tax=Brassica napus TaxID=3708 RepID=A0A816IL56_BRANA|nr:unnamed protein product [Brassica napus]
MAGRVEDHAKWITKIFHTRHCCEKGDVFALGPFLDKKSAKDIVNPWLGKELDQTEIKQVMTTASMYVHHIATMRPDMNRIAVSCEGERTSCRREDASSNPGDIESVKKKLYVAKVWVRNFKNFKSSILPVMMPLTFFLPILAAKNVCDYIYVCKPEINLKNDLVLLIR